MISNFTSENVPKEMKTTTWRDTCTPMFIALYVYNSQMLKPTQMSNDKWIDKQNVVNT